jgi:hypothetical protein
MTFIVGQRVRLRADADLVAAFMDHLEPACAGLVAEVDQISPGSVMVAFDADPDMILECDPEWLEVLASFDPACHRPG